MNRLHLVSGVTGVGKTSFKGILIGEKIATNIFESTLEEEDIKNLIQAKNQDKYIVMFYIGLNSALESIRRVNKNNDDTPSEKIIKEFNSRIEALKRVLPYCDEVIFYDNENGFVKVGEIKNKKFEYKSSYVPAWIEQFKQDLCL